MTTNYTNASFLDPNVGTGKTVNVSGLNITAVSMQVTIRLGNTTAATTANITIADQTINVIQTMPLPTASEGTDFIVVAAVFLSDYPSPLPLQVFVLAVVITLLLLQ